MVKLRLIILLHLVFSRLDDESFPNLGNYANYIEVTKETFSFFSM
uniref:Uncharacterized protein n=1 Tax=Arundo donax TaxID=35708 RepID=A0A0A9SEK0_ARUDO